MCEDGMPNTRMSASTPQGNARDNEYCKLTKSLTHLRMGVLSTNPTSPTAKMPALINAVRVGRSRTPSEKAVGCAQATAAPSNTKAANTMYWSRLTNNIAPAIITPSAPLQSTILSPKYRTSTPFTSRNNAVAP